MCSAATAGPGSIEARMCAPTAPRSVAYAVSTISSKDLVLTNINFACFANSLRVSKWGERHLDNMSAAVPPIRLIAFQFSVKWPVGGTHSDAAPTEYRIACRW